MKKFKWTVPIAAAILVSKQNIPAQAAAALVSLIPSLFIVLAIQRALVRGFGCGIIKG